ncbi:MAG: PadR family transcriptional regulator [Rhizobiales bacterium]|nr:PadR family transcriptional regulator [Hyphomicrobiales bacterium]
MNVRTLCLAILYFGEATGYEIRKQAAEGCFSHFIEASYGSIYPALTRLTQEGLIRCREEHASGKPTRKIYELTELGRAELVSALHETPRTDVFKSEFLLQGVCAELIDVRHLELMLAERERHLEEQLESLRRDEASVADRPGTLFAVQYGIALTEAALGHVRARGSLLLEAARRKAPAAA